MRSATNEPLLLPRHGTEHHFARLGTDILLDEEHHLGVVELAAGQELLNGQFAQWCHMFTAFFGFAA